MATTGSNIETIAERVTRALDEAGISRIRVAQELGIDRVNVWKRLTGRVPLRIDELQTLAELAGVPVAALVDGTDKAAS